MFGKKNLRDGMIAILSDENNPLANCMGIKHPTVSARVENNQFVLSWFKFSLDNYNEDLTVKGNKEHGITDGDVLEVYTTENDKMNLVWKRR